MDSSKKKSRSLNFTAEEEFVLGREYMARGRILNGEFSTTLTASHKHLAWAEILEAVNAVSPTTRTLETIKNKWKDLKKRTKAKLSANKVERQKTGGGVANVQPLTSTEELVETQIGTASVMGVGCSETFSSVVPGTICTTSLDETIILEPTGWTHSETAFLFPISTQQHPSVTTPITAPSTAFLNLTRPSVATNSPGPSATFTNCTGPSVTTNLPGPSATFTNCAGPSVATNLTGPSATFTNCAGPSVATNLPGPSATFTNCAGPSVPANLPGPSAATNLPGPSATFTNCAGPSVPANLPGPSATFTNCAGPSVTEDLPGPLAKNSKITLQKQFLESSTVLNTEIQALKKEIIESNVLKLELINMKKEENAARKRRHEELMEIKKEKIKILRELSIKLDNNQNH